MFRVVVHTVYSCDGTHDDQGFEITYPYPFNAASKMAAKDGWTGSGGFNFCPECSCPVAQALKAEAAEIQVVSRTPVLA